MTERAEADGSAYRVRATPLPSMIGGLVGPGGTYAWRVWHRPCGFRITVKSGDEAVRERRDHRCHG